jgi:hypothetical protein
MGHPCYFGLHRSRPRAILAANGDRATWGVKIMATMLNGLRRWMWPLLTGLTLSLVPRLGVVQHPLDPIGSSPSNAIRTFYAIILAVSMALGGLLTIWLQARLARSR